ncbi:MAG: hypothetical protein LBR05_04450 [Azoarcus sp.]|jgi:hypothetical protein|nr:hypothetical protein [Azoarcus sp.]
MTQSARRLWLILPLLLALTPPNATADERVSLFAGKSLRGGQGGIRHGSVYLRASAADRVRVDWRAEWQADANAEEIYLVDGGGRLAARLDVATTQGDGTHEFALAASEADYQLDVPGYSFRAWRVSHGATTAAQFEPAKVHFSVVVPAGVELYFRVAAGEAATLAGKHHGGVDALRVERLSDGKTLELPLKKYAAYRQFDHLPLPVSARDEVWRLKLAGSGKAAFWLDGAANLFAASPQQLHPLVLATGAATLTLGKGDAGPAPRLGLALPYATPSPAALDLLKTLGVRAANYYSFVDASVSKRDMEFSYRRLYRDAGIDRDVTLLSASGRAPVLAADAKTLSALDAWLAASARLAPGALHYLGFADEPNLNYSSFDDFAAYFAAMLQRVKETPGARAAGVRVAVPASSRWLNGPSRDGAAKRRGIDWARALLARHGDDIDALVWHEWMTRDLFATRRIRTDVRAAADLVGLDAAGRPRKALIVGQANVSSGNALSPYDQDTFFAAQWWTSTVVNAARDGLLDMLVWFRAVDDADYPKGMLRMQGEAFTLKPVALAQRFLARRWLDRVSKLDNDAFEVDALALRDGARHALVGVNKTPRRQRVTLNDAVAACASSATLRLLLPDGSERDATVDCGDKTPRFTLPGNTIFALEWKAP